MPSFVVGFLPICLPFAVAFSIPLFALALIIDNSNWLKTPAIGTVPIPYDCPRICILRKLCEQKGIEIHEANACPDHIHMLVSIPPKISVAYALLNASYTRLKGYCFLALVAKRSLRALKSSCMG